MDKKRIYLACPYTHSDPKIMELRAKAATITAAQLMEEGHLVFSPITQGHEMCKHGIAPDFSAWAEMDLSILKLWATEMLIVAAEGMKASHGVKQEMLFAEKHKIPTAYIFSGALFDLGIKSEMGERLKKRHGL